MVLGSLSRSSQLLLILTIRLTLNGINSIVAPYGPYFANQLDVHPQEMSIIYFLKSIFCLPVILLLVLTRRTWGAVPHRNWILFFGAMGVFVTIGNSFATSMAGFVVARSLFGFAYYGLSGAITGFLSQTDIEKLGCMASLSELAGTGGLLYVPIVGFLYEQIGWQWTWRLCLIPVVVAIGLVWVCVPPHEMDDSLEVLQLTTSAAEEPRLEMGSVTRPAEEQKTAGEMKNMDELEEAEERDSLVYHKELYLCFVGCAIGGYLFQSPATVYGLWMLEKFGGTVAQSAGYSLVIAFGGIVADFTALGVLDSLRAVKCVYWSTSVGILCTLPVVGYIFSGAVIPNTVGTLAVSLAFLTVLQYLGEFQLLVSTVLAVEQFNSVLELSVRKSQSEFSAIAWAGLTLGMALQGLVIPIVWEWKWEIVPAIWLMLFVVQFGVVWPLHDPSRHVLKSSIAVHKSAVSPRLSLE